MSKYIFVTGGVVSSLGKGITASAIGRLLKNRGLSVFMQKFDPYINIDPGTMSPYQHGEVYVTDDGAETDLDLGHYERFVDVRLSKDSNVTTGKIYQSVIEKERKGFYGGRTVQVIPHITDEIKLRLRAAARSEADIVITEIGGTVGDIESTPFLEAIRQWRSEVGIENSLYIHTTLVPYLKASGELKTKPTQHSVKELRAIGIQPDIIVLRSEEDIDDDLRQKISSFCDVKKEAVVVARDVDILYEVAVHLHEQKIDDVILDHFHLEAPRIDLASWEQLIERIRSLSKTVHIALVGKYVQLHDAYLSVSEALKHAGYHFDYHVKIHWIFSGDLKEDNYEEILAPMDGILVPGGFGSRATKGTMLASQYAREHQIPFLGICYGMQLAAIEFAQNVLHLAGANSTELDENTPYAIIDYLPDQYQGIDLGGTLRLGLYDCRLREGTKAHHYYGKSDIQERHRHRYEFNNQFADLFEEAGMIVSGYNPQANLVEIMELQDHPYFITCQFHPEFLSRPLRPHPLFVGLIEHAIKQSKKHKK